MKLRVADVGLDSRTAGSDAVYSYAASPSTGVGEAYFVPLGPRRAIGFVLAVREVDPRDLGFDPNLLKPLGSRIHGLDLPTQTLELVHEVARQTLTPVSVCLSLAAPPGIRERLATEWRRTAIPAEGSLTASQRETLAVLESGPITERKGKPLSEGAIRTLRSLQRRGLVETVVSLIPLAERHRISGSLRLTPDSRKVDAFLTGPGRRRPAQAITLMRLQGSESASFTAQEIKSLGGVTDQTIKALIEAKLLEPVVGPDPETASIPTPNPHQAAAISAIQEAISVRKPDRFLLYGITGSGKTEVYLRAAQEALAQGRQVLYLVPEIALTAQVIAQLRVRFGQRVAVWHSNMSATERIESWMRIQTGQAPVVLGARSALFAPLSNVGLIILDEEHEQSYKQDSAPRYHAHRIAGFLADAARAPLVLGSATPSIETYFASETERIRRLELPVRAAQAQLPTVHIEDLTEAYRERHVSVLSGRLQQALTETLARDEQAILFLNRRAYAPFLVCRDCGHRFPCPRCSVTLSFHRRDRRLRCHHCDHHEPAPELCPQCESNKIAPFGVGVERVEETVATLFPEVNVGRLDRDVARKKGGLEETLAQFRSGETRILVGTQMVAKGLDFPRVTLVGVIAADLSLGIPDFRASERTFQLLTQVAGRAGRGDRPGQVIIQTLNPEHPSLVCAKDHDFLAFYNALIQEREEAGYPPFRRMVNVIATGENRGRVVEVSQQVSQAIREAMPDADVLGPVDCPLERLNNLWRRHVVVKLSPETSPEPIKVLNEISHPGVRLTVDIDPYNLS